MCTDGSYRSQWEFGNQLASAINSPELVYPQPGTFPVTLKVNSDFNCADSLTRYITVHALPSIVVGKDTVVEKGTGIKLQAVGGKKYSWFPTDGLNNPLLANPFADILDNSTYIVEGVDVNGCVNRDTINIKVTESFSVMPMNVVTPDLNGLNDTWNIINIDAYPNNNLVIFDSRNEKVFEAGSYDNTWDGRNSRGELLPDGTYYYILTIEGAPKKFSGFISLLRNLR